MTQKLLLYRDCDLMDENRFIVKFIAVLGSCQEFGI